MTKEWAALLWLLGLVFFLCGMGAVMVFVAGAKEREEAEQEERELSDFARLCPKCKEPMTFNKADGQWHCRNMRCSEYRRCRNCGSWRGICSC